MLPVILVAVGAYLIGDSVLGDGKKYAKGGKLGKSFMMGDEEVYIKDSSISLDDEVCLFYKKDDSILKCISKNQFDKFVEQGKLVPKMTHGGKTQGYDDKEDERLAMEHGKMSKKDLDSTHARRDDAEFEERGKMAKGGEVGGRGWEGATKGKRIKNIKELEKNHVYLNYDPRFNSKNLIMITGLDKTGLNRPIVYGSFLRKGVQENDFAIWDDELKDNEFYEAKDKKFADEYMAKGGKLVGKQKNLDVNKNGKLDAEDFKMLRGEKMAKGGETKMPYKEFEETLREYEIEGGFGKTKEKGYEMYYLPNGNPYLNTKFNHRNKKKAYQQYVKMDR